MGGGGGVACNFCRPGHKIAITVQGRQNAHFEPNILTCPLLGSSIRAGKFQFD